MIILNIKKQDGSLYWTEAFESEEECDKWVNEEKTRPYWDEKFSLHKEKIAPNIAQLEKDRADLAKKHKDKADRKAMRKAIDWAKLKIDPDVKEILKSLVEELEDQV